MKPRYSAPAFNMILLIEYKSFSLMKHFYTYLCVGNNKNLGIEWNSKFIEIYNFYQCYEMRFSRV